MPSPLAAPELQGTIRRASDRGMARGCPLMFFSSEQVSHIGFHPRVPPRR